MSHSTATQVKVQMFFSKYVTSPKLHGLMYRLSSGRIGSRLPGVQPEVLLLTARGRKTCKLRTTPLVYFSINGEIVVAATNNGDHRNPDWYLNLMVDPDAWIQIGRTCRTVCPRLVEGAERSRLWSEVTRIHPLFAAYQDRTHREIPLVVLESPVQAG